MNAEYQKLTQAAKYLASKYPQSQLYRLMAVKLLFLADRYHLRKYGRPLAWDNYNAMPKGMAGSTAMDLLELDNDALSEEVLNYAKKHIETTGFQYRVVGDIDRGELSETDIEALNFVYEVFGDLDRFVLAELTHVFPEWRAHEQEAKASRAAVSYEEFFGDPSPEDPIFKQHRDALIVYLANSNQYAKDIFQEGKKQANLWK